MALPKINPETYRRVCTKEVLCDKDKAQRFLADTLAYLEKSNPHLFSFLSDVVFGTSDQELMKHAKFDAANCGAAICKMFAEEGTLPTVSGEVRYKVTEEFTEDPEISQRMRDTKNIVDICALKVIAVCSGNYELLGYKQEATFVQTIAFMVCRMIWFQSELAPVEKE